MPPPTPDVSRWPPHPAETHHPATSYGGPPPGFGPQPGYQGDYRVPQAGYGGYPPQATFPGHDLPMRADPGLGGRMPPMYGDPRAVGPMYGGNGFMNPSGLQGPQGFPANVLPMRSGAVAPDMHMAPPVRMSEGPVAPAPGPAPAAPHGGVAPGAAGPGLVGSMG